MKSIGTGTVLIGQHSKRSLDWFLNIASCVSDFGQYDQYGPNKATKMYATVPFNVQDYIVYLPTKFIDRKKN